ncbi:MAG TPA: ATP-binding cassette domain-containing protein, partial [Salinimicrobium sp.]|nr:ATP-binding cassette domain-containing protein [Salinimicrobium sp.]
MIFEIDNTELYFEGKQILNGIYLKAETGKITGILGANGCGKSSLLKIIFGSLKPRHKLIRIDKKAYLKPLFLLGMVKYLPQHNIFPKDIKIGTAFKFYEVSWKDFQQDFPQLPIQIWQKVGELSGGETRIFETYLTLKSDSKIVLLDEPFTHLSPLYIEKFIEMIRQESKNKAILLTDHMYRHILDLADDIYLLQNACSKLINKTSDLEDYHYLRP